MLGAAPRDDPKPGRASAFAVSASIALLPIPASPNSPSTRPEPRRTSPIARVAEANCGSRPSNSMTP